MTTLKQAFLLAATSLSLLSACKKSANLNDSLTAVPKDAVSVTGINIPSLMQKADFESVKNMEFYKETIADAEKENSAMAEIMKDPKKSGIDLTKNIYFVQDYSFSGSGNVSVLMSIADSKAFEAMLQNAKAGDVQTKDGVKFINMEKEMEETNADGYKINYNKGGIVAWNDKLVVLSSKMSENTEGGTIFQFFKTKPEESIAQNEELKKVMSSSHDVYSFLSFDKWGDDMQAKAAAGAMNVDPKALKGNYFTGYSDFEKGQIVSKSEFKINKDITKQWGIIFKDNVKTDFSKYMNGQNLGFAMTLGLDMKGLKEIINSSQEFRMMTKLGEGAINYSIDDLCKALDGDIVIAASPSATKDKWSGMLGFRISDKASIQKLLDALTKEEILVSEGNNAYHFAGMADAMSKSYVEDSKIMISDDVLFVGDNATVSGLNGKGSVNSDVKDVLNKNIFGMYADFNKIFAQTDDMKDPEVTEMKLMIGSKTGEGVFKMRDQNENSLKSLMKTLNRLYLKNKENKAKMEQPEEGENAEKEAI